MKHLRSYWRGHSREVLLSIVALAAIAWLLLHKLGSLTTGISSQEAHAATAAVGWHGIFQQPLDLPLKLVRSVVFAVAPDHGQLLTRLPNTLFGFLAITSFAWLIWLWHGRRTALMATLLFATGAWTLHVSRLASFDVLYLWATPTILLIQLLLQKYGTQARVWYSSLLLWGLLLYVPGLIWLMLLSIYMQRNALVAGWKHFNLWWQRTLTVLAIFIWIPLLALNFGRHGQLMQWLGLPAHFAAPATLAKHFIAVFVHLFIRGPQYPDLWLGRAPILDIFTLVACFIGIYFYASRLSSKRSRSLLATFVIGVLLATLGGPVGLSVLVPLLYMAAATGLAYLLHDWLKIFPLNPLARGLGIGLVSIAVMASCVYNYRAYFIAWPHNSVTEATFHEHR